MMDPPHSGPQMEARAAPGGSLRGRRDPEERLAEDPFFYGYRWVRVETAAGKTVSEQFPLTREDLLDPQEDDHVSNRAWHDLITGRLGEILRTLFASRDRDDVLVTANVKMLWRDPGVKRVAPDLAVIPGVDDPERDFSSFDEAEEGTRPVFVLEVLSEATERTDHDDKPAVYRRAGVEEYFILDQMQTPWTLEARRLHPVTRRYRKVRLGKNARVASETLEVRFEVGEDGKSLVVTDLVTGQGLRDHLGETEARRAAEEGQRAEAEARRAAEQAQSAAEQARRAAEERYRAETEARRAAEQARSAVEEENRRLKALLDKLS